MNPQFVAPLVMVPIVLLGIWRRVRIQFGLQPIKRKRMITRVVVLLVLGVLISSAALNNPHLLEGLLGGVLLGAALGLLGLRLTQFKLDPVKGDCYLPNPWLGVLLTALLVARLLWRFAIMLPAMQGSAPAGPVPHAPLGQSPLTMLMFGLVIGYYVCYFLGLLIHHRRWQAQQTLQRGPVQGP